jgi:large subunit ribosomal protein L5
MSSSVANNVASATRAVRFRRTPLSPKHLKKDDRGLPRPPVPILIRETHPSRLQDHYHNTLADDLLYLTYKHESGPRPPPRQIRLAFDPNDPYTKNRKNPPVGGSQEGKKPAPPSSPETVPKLLKISLHTMTKESIQNRSSLLGAIMAFRAISGQTQGGGGRHRNEGVQIIRGKKTVGGWIRPGIPCGVKVDLKGEQMWEFLGTLSEVVLPRLREFNGVVMPPGTFSMQTPAGVSGVVSFGLPPVAMGFFPQIEVNQDAYSKMYGMHIHFVTNATGQGAQNRARALVSGFQIPFARK